MSATSTPEPTARSRRHTREIIEQIEVTAYTIPTETPESDGTLEWNQTTLVVVELVSEGVRGLGYSYADVATLQVIKDHLVSVVHGREVMNVPGTWLEMVRALRNLGRPGICSMALAAVDVALWDLKARMLLLPLVDLLGRVRDTAPVYGSGGFCSYSMKQLQDQLGGWVQQGISKVKMKVGRDSHLDRDRVREARDAIGTNAELFIDANGAFTAKRALAFAEFCTRYNVSWFEEPVSSDDLEGLRLVRQQGPAGMDIAAGEYAYDAYYFRRMLEAEAVDCLQADATRCAGITGFLQAASLCEAWNMPLSAHTAPSLHAHLGCAVRPFRHVEYFFDHSRIEQMLFEGALVPVKGELQPNRKLPGLGLTLRKSEAKRYAI